MHTHTHYHKHTAREGFSNVKIHFLPHVFISKTRSPFLVLSKKCGNKTQTARTATAAKNVVSKGNRQETNMAIHFLKPEALSLSLSLSLYRSLSRGGDGDSSSRHIPNIVDEQRSSSSSSDGDVQRKIALRSCVWQLK